MNVASIISMIKYLQKIIDEIPEVLRVTKSCRAGDNLFNIIDYEDRELLPEEMARQFHRTTAQLFLLCKRSIPDIETLVSFLTTRVKESDVDNLGGVEAWSYLPQGYAVHETLLYSRLNQKYCLVGRRIF